MAEIRAPRVLIDLNVLLDSLLARTPWDNDAHAIWQTHDRGLIRGYVAAHALTNLFYITRRSIGTVPARIAYRLCVLTFEIIPVGRAELERADSLPGTDIEDNLVLACAIQADLDAIITRDPSGFSGSPLPVETPASFLARLTPEPETPPNGASADR